MRRAVAARAPPPPAAAHQARRWFTPQRKRLPAAVPARKKDPSHTSMLHCSGPLKLQHVDKLMGYAEKVQPDFVMVSGGLLGGGVMGDKGKANVRCLNALNVKYLTLSPCDFFFGPEVLQERIAEFNGTVLCCNVDGLEGVERMAKVRRGGRLHLTGYVDVVRPGFTVRDGMDAVVQQLTVDHGNPRTEDFYLCMTAQSIDRDHDLGARAPPKFEGAQLPMILGSSQMAPCEERLPNGVRILHPGTTGETVSHVDVWDATVHRIVTRPAPLDGVTKFKSSAMFDVLRGCAAMRGQLADTPVLTAPSRGELPKEVRRALEDAERKKKALASRRRPRNKAGGPTASGEDENEGGEGADDAVGGVDPAFDGDVNPGLPRIGERLNLTDVQTALQTQLKIRTLSVLRDLLGVDACVMHEGSFNNRQVFKDAMTLRQVPGLLPYPSRMCVVELSSAEFRALLKHRNVVNWGPWTQGDLHFDAHWGTPRAADSVDTDADKIYRVALPRVLVSGLYNVAGLERLKPQVALLPDMAVMDVLKTVAMEALEAQAGENVEG